MGYTILFNAGDWEKFKEDFAKAHDIMVAAVGWGAGPPEFPCGVIAIHFPLGHRVMCGYMTVADADGLIQAIKDHCIKKEEEEPSPPVRARVGRDLAAEVDELRKVVKEHMEQDRAYAISNSAHLRVHLKRGFHTAFYRSPEEYEKEYAESLSYIDQLAEEQKYDLTLKTFKLPEE